MKTLKSLLIFSLLISLLNNCSRENPIININAKSKMPQLRRQGDATQLIVDEVPFLMLGGELHNSSMGGQEYMRHIWKRLADANLNTVIATASWELVEPEEGRFDFALVDSMILGARKEGLKLVVIWFGSWKNGESTYAPAWVKLDQKRFPLVKNENGNSLNILSTFSEEAKNADAKAFAALMKHIRQIDGKHHTVLMMQVENEMGTLRTKRNYCEVANAAFNSAVPAELMGYLEKNKATLHPGILEAWGKQGFPVSGTWEEVFGKGVLTENWKGLSYLTEELFMAWNYAKYVEKVARAGRAEYNLPMYVNAWLKQPDPAAHAPGNYPSGGPSPQVIDVWRAAAPSIDLIAPDIYIVDEFRYVCDQYTLSGNPLFIPETTGDAAGAARSFFVFGRYSGICFSPFGIDGGDAGANVEKISDIRDSYGTLKQLIPLILQYQGTANISGLMADELTLTDSVIIGGYKIKGTLSKRWDFAMTGVTGGQSPSDHSGKPAGGALIICTGQGQYVIAGRNMSLNFSIADPQSGKKVSFLSLEDGKFVNSKWVTGRRLNGDEFWIFFPPDGSKIYKLSLYQY
jgi:Domain of unknown function (DUF5597)/Beta-galactosidase